MRKQSKKLLVVFIISIAFSCSQEKSIINFISEKDWTDLTMRTVRDGCADFKQDSVRVPQMAFNDSVFNTNSDLLLYRLSLRKKFLEYLNGQKEIDIGRQLRVVERYEDHIYFAVQASNGEFYVVEFLNDNDITPRLRKAESYLSFFRDVHGGCVDETKFGWVTGLAVASLISIDKAGLTNYTVSSVILF